MKRQIVCDKCFWEKMPNQMFPGEWRKTKSGKARTEMFCDLCAADIEKDEHCYAESIGLDGQPYYSWESKYIKEE